MAAEYSGMNDVTAWAEKDTRGAYAPGHTMKIGGKSVKVAAVPDYIGGKAKRSKRVARR